MYKKILLRKYSELSEEEKSAAIRKHGDILEFRYEEESPDFIHEEEAKLEEIGFSDVKISYTGFYSQGDGACFTGVLENPLSLEDHGVTCPIYIKDLLAEGVCFSARLVHEGRYFHENSVDLYLSVDFPRDTNEDDIDYKYFDQYEDDLQEWCRKRSREIYAGLEAIDRECRKEVNVAEYLEDSFCFGEDLDIYNLWEVEDDASVFDKRDFDDLLFTAKRLLMYFKDHLSLLAEYACTTSSENRKELEDRFYGEKALSLEDQERVKNICEKYLKEIVDAHDISEAICGVKNADTN